MYEKYYNLKAMPFQITADPRFLWLGEKHSEALATLKYGVLENKGFLLLTGDVGTGKTALINLLVKMIDKAVLVAKVPDPGLNSLDFFNFLAVEFKMNQKFDSKGAFLIQLRNFLYKAHTNRKRVLLIIDEAQRLNHELLEQIRLLSNIELQSRKLINIFFVGQPEFGAMLMQDRNRAVRQRITISYHIKPLTEGESGQYIRHRLKVAGATGEIFSKDAIRAIFSFSKGYPRLINIICDHALLTAYASGLKSIDKKVIQECERELRIPLEIGFDRGDGQGERRPNQIQQSTPPPEKSSRLAKMGVMAAAIMLLAFGIYYFTVEKSGVNPRWSMEKIAPRQFNGPLPDNSKASDNPEVSAREPNKVRQTIKDAPKEETAAGSEIRQPSVDRPSDLQTRQPVETQKPPATVQQPAPAPSGKTKKSMRGIQEVAPLPERKLIIYFPPNSNELPEQYFETLNRIAAFLLQSPSASIDIKGYTDSTGSYIYNVSVSEFRANTIKTYLVGRGVPPSRIKSAGLGPENPIATDDTEEGRQKNRRVEVKVNVE
ncbi:MAG: OmpA family protein [Desulfobacterales bacterium]